MKLLVAALLFGQARPQFASEETCNTATDQDEPRIRECRTIGGKDVWYYLRPRESADKTNAINYAANLDSAAKAAQDQCTQNDSTAPNAAKIAQGYERPGCFQGYSLGSTFKFQFKQGGDVQVLAGTPELTAFPSACGDRNANASFCQSSPAGVRQSCALTAAQSPQSTDLRIMQTCEPTRECEAWSQNGGSWQYTACPNTQCPAFTYRAGAQARARSDGKYVYARITDNSGQPCIAQPGESYTAYQARCETVVDSDLNNRIEARSASLPQPHYPRYNPFECVHDDCDSTYGWFIKKGNSDTGPVNHFSSVNGADQQYTINPFLKNAAGFETISSHDRQQSEGQGRCGQCSSNQSSTDAEDIMNYRPSQYDDAGKLRAGEFNSPKKWGRGSLSCYTCPVYQRRDLNGNCKEHVCQGALEYLVRDGQQQGQCLQCSQNSIPDALGKSCEACSAGKTAVEVRNAAGRFVAECRAQACNDRQISLASGDCQTCGNYECAVKLQNPQVCAPPVCRGNNEIVKADCSCQECAPGSTPDARKRSCQGLTCPAWTRLQSNGQCTPDNCPPRHKNVQAGALQGQCTPCPDWEIAAPGTRSCMLPTCPPGQAYNRQGACYTCQRGGTVSANGRDCQAPRAVAQPVATACQPYTRRQSNNQCRPDACAANERNMARDELVNRVTQQQGSCVPCPPGQRGGPQQVQHLNARITCESQACQANQIISRTGQCQTCNPNSQPNSNKSACVPLVQPVQIQCTGNQYRQCYPASSANRNGFTASTTTQTCRCASCPTGYQPTPARNTCIRVAVPVVPVVVQVVQCTADQYRDGSGHCVRCPGYPRSVPSVDGTRCQQKTCATAGQYLNAGGVCDTCQPGYCVSPLTRNACYKPTCTERTIIKNSCQTEQCPPYTRSKNECRECLPDTCTARQYLGQNGRCSECGPYTVPDPRNQNRGTCIAPTCEQNQIIGRNGACQTCPAGQNPDQFQRICTRIACGIRSKIVTENNVTRCVPCPAGTKAQDLNTRCAADTCDTASKRFYISTGGTCVPCGQYQVANEAGDRCEEPTCGPNAVITNQGTCQTCPEYFRRYQYPVSNSPANRQQQRQRAACIPCSCNSFGRQYCLPNGQCETCGDFLITNAEGKGCRTPTCDINTPKLQSNGQCTACPAYHSWDEGAQECAQTVCPERSMLMANGSCQECPEYYSLHTDGKQCIPCRCGIDEICNVDGTCGVCEDFHIVVSSGENRNRACVKPVCPNGVLQTDGTCKPCGACEKLNEDKSECLKEVCNDRSILQYDGSCFQCEDYFEPRFRAADDQCGGQCGQCLPTAREYILTNGLCETCPNYSKISPDRRSCDPVDCVDNQYKTLDGQCVECPAFTRVDAERIECITTPCLDNEILQADGICVPCDRYFRADVAQRTCIQSPCTSRQFYDEAGNCLDCEPCTRSTEDKLGCFSDAELCTARDILNNDGTCRTCPSYQTPTAVNLSTGICGKVCENVVCLDANGIPDNNSYILEDGTCMPCDPWTRPSEDQRVCGPQVCGIRQKLLFDGSCEDCPDYSRGNGEQQRTQYTQCLPDQCADNQILTSDGTCAYCGPYEKADADQRACVEPVCGARTKLLQDATLVDCLEYTRSSPDCRTCRGDQCTLIQKLLPTGECEDCPSYERAAPDGKSCMRYTCEINQILRTDGTCEACAPFTKAAPDGLKCQEVICTQVERLLPSGECEPCEAYSRAINDGKACAPNLCTSRQRVLQDGTCEDCPDFKRAFAGGRECASQVCTPRQILLIDGRCADCYPYTRASADGETCVPHSCKDRQKLGPDGTCVDCPDYERAQGNALTCGPDTCNVRQRVLQDGTCKYCPLYQSVCANRRCCSKPTCRPQVEYISKDGVCQPCAFHQRTGPDGTTCVTDPNKKSPDPQVIAPTPVSLESTNMQEPACCTTAGCDVWTEEQFLSEDQATGFYLNQATGNLGFMLGTGAKLGATVASLFTAVLIALNAI